MINFALILKITEKTLSRDHTFFANPNRHKTWAEDRLNVDAAKIADLNLQCVGYGEFHVGAIVSRFTTYLKNCIKQMPNLKNLRLKINGFDLKDCPNLITDVCETIDQMSKVKLKLLQLQTTRLINCDINRDFAEIMKCALRLGIKERHGLIKAQNQFQTLTLQFADWQFILKGEKLKQQRSKSKSKPKGKLKKKQKQSVHASQRSQPSPQVLRNQLNLIQDQAFNTNGYCFKRFRLQLSTWYYTQKEFEIFVHSYSVRKFHEQMQQFVRSCYNNMPDLEYFQLDLRNWYSKFMLTKLRDILIMIPKQGVQNMSINSKNISRIRRRTLTDKDNSVFYHQDDQNDDVPILFERHVIV